MKILVTIKEVAELADDFEISGLEIKERYKEYVLNEWDEYAIESAVQISENQVDDVEIISVTIGPKSTEETIRLALAKDVDRAIRAWDDSFTQNPVDVRERMALLEAIVKREEPDLILTGVQAEDDGFGVTGVMLAERMGYQWAAVVNQLEIIDGSANVRRELEGGVEEVTTVSLPAVLTVQTGINSPRYASLRGIRQAKQKEIEEITPADLDIDLEQYPSQLEQRTLIQSKSESDVFIYKGDADKTATELAEVLREEGVNA